MQKRNPRASSAANPCGGAWSFSPANSSCSKRPASSSNTRPRTRRVSPRADWPELIAADTGRDRLKDLGCQTLERSVRAHSDDLAESSPRRWRFSAAARCSLARRHAADPALRAARQTARPIPMRPSSRCPENAVYRVDRLSWLRRLFDLSCEEYDRLDLDRNDPVGELATRIRRRSGWPLRTRHALTA